MSFLSKPSNVEDVLETVKSAISAVEPVSVIGSGTKKAFGRPVHAQQTIDLSGLKGIEYYEPQELVITAAAGTPLAEIEAALEAEDQYLPFEPYNIERLLGQDPNSGTLGGALAANLSGPRRFYAGAARDHCLGFEAVSGRGEVFKSGGRVIKNVTGFDLSKLMVGSFGTLGIMTSVSLKVLPAPEITRTILLPGGSLEVASEQLSKALRSPHAVNGAAFLPAPCAARSSIGYVSAFRGGVTALRIQGHRPSVEARLAALKETFKGAGQIEELHTHNSRILWREIGDATLLTAGSDTQVWRLSIPPSELVSAVTALSEQLDTEFFTDWGGGLLWIAIPARADANHEGIFSVAERQGGHATLMRAMEDVRESVPVFQPQAQPLADLTRRLKDNFDPHRILNPGRMYKDL